MKFKKYFELLVEKQGSDLFLRALAEPRARIDGEIQCLSDQKLSENDMAETIEVLLKDKVHREILEKNRDVDFVFQEEKVGRFRINLFFQRGSIALVARHIKESVPNIVDLNLPEELCKQFTKESRGLVLVCGPAGSGKTTSVASMIDYINEKEDKHIVTLEDPIEFLFQDKKSIINQRELGSDFFSYPNALRFVTQQSPDVVFVGTIRDEATMKAAINAAELGVLVFATFHTNNAVQTLERMINFFPPYLHKEVCLQLSLLLKGTLSLRLMKCKDGKGRIPAYESMVVTPSVARLIREQNPRDILSFINDGKMFGMKSFKQTLAQLVKNDIVDEEVACASADSKDEFNLELSGIRRVNRGES